MAEEYLSTDPNAGLQDEYISTDPNAGIEQPKGGIVQNAIAGAGDVIKGFAQQFVPRFDPATLATIAFPQIQGYHALKSIVDTAEQVHEAEKTEPYSRERFAAGFNVAGQLGLLALGARKPTLKEIATGEKPVEAMPQTPERPISEVAAQQTQTIPEAVPKVEEVIQNAEQIQGPARPDVNVQLPGGAQAREGYGGEMPADVGGEGVPPRGQGETLQQTPQEVAAPVPQPEQPTIDDLHNKLAVDIVEGSGYKDWEEQVVANLIKDGESPESAQKMVDEWDNNTRLTYLTNKWKDYWKANPQEFADEYANSFPDEPPPIIPKGGEQIPSVGQPKPTEVGPQVGRPEEVAAEPPPPAAPPPVETAVAPEAPQKPSKIGKSIEAKAVESKLTEGFKDTAGYDPITIKDQAERATRFVKESPTDARAVIRGDAALPEGLRGTSLITAMEEELIRKPDPKLAYELANSPLVSETSAAAQEMRLMSERVPDSLAAKFQEIKAARKAGSKLRGETTESVFQEIRQEIVRQSSKRPTWEAFVKSIEC